MEIQLKSEKLIILNKLHYEVMTISRFGNPF